MVTGVHKQQDSYINLVSNNKIDNQKYQSFEQLMLSVDNDRPEAIREFRGLFGVPGRQTQDEKERLATVLERRMGRAIFAFNTSRKHNLTRTELILIDLLCNDPNFISNKKELLLEKQKGVGNNGRRSIFATRPYCATPTNVEELARKIGGGLPLENIEKQKVLRPFKRQEPVLTPSEKPRSVIEPLKTAPRIKTNEVDQEELPKRDVMEVKIVYVDHLGGEHDHPEQKTPRLNSPEPTDKQDQRSMQRLENIRSNLMLPSSWGNFLHDIKILIDVASNRAQKGFPSSNPEELQKKALDVLNEVWDVARKGKFEHLMNDQTLERYFRALCRQTIRYAVDHALKNDLPLTSVRQSLPPLILELGLKEQSLDQVIQPQRKVP